MRERPRDSARSLGASLLRSAVSETRRTDSRADSNSIVGQDPFMIDWSVVSRDHVLEAMRECDDLGCAEFLARYRYGPSRTYHVVHHGREYPSKAILGVAYGRAAGAVPR